MRRSYGLTYSRWQLTLIGLVALLLPGRRSAVTAASKNRDILLARYRENADQARHHEVLRDRSTAMVAQTSGVLLGLLGLKEGSIAENPAYRLVGVLIMVLGAWGIYSSLVFESRARRHRKRIREILVRLEEPVGERKDKHSFIWVWVLFHALIAGVGATVTFYPWPHAKAPKADIRLVGGTTQIPEESRRTEKAHNTAPQPDGYATG